MDAETRVFSSENPELSMVLPFEPGVCNSLHASPVVRSLHALPVVRSLHASSAVRGLHASPVVRNFHDSHTVTLPYKHLPSRSIQLHFFFLNPLATFLLGWICLTQVPLLAIRINKVTLLVVLSD